MTSLKTALSTIGERAKAATEGPWVAIPGDSYDAYPHVKAKNSSFIVYDHADVDQKTAAEDFKFPGVEADAAFIAAARQDVPKLLAVIDALIEQRNKCIAKYSDNAFDAKRERDSADVAILFILTATESKGELK